MMYYLMILAFRGGDPMLKKFIRFWQLNEPIILFILASACLACAGFLFSLAAGLVVISLMLFALAFVSAERG